MTAMGALVALAAGACLVSEPRDCRPPDPECAIGSEGCACTEGGACDDDLACADDRCIDVSSPAPIDEDEDEDEDLPACAAPVYWRR